MFICEHDLDIVGFSISKRIVQVGDFAVEGGAPHEQGENNVISDQNIFLAENSLWFSSSLKNRESQCNFYSWPKYILGWKRFVWFSSCPSRSHFWRWLPVAVEYTNKLTTNCWLSVQILAPETFVSDGIHNIILEPCLHHHHINHGNNSVFKDFRSPEISKKYFVWLVRHLKTLSRERSKKCNLCEYASSRAGHLRTHLKI